MLNYDEKNKCKVSILHYFTLAEKYLEFKNCIYRIYIIYQNLNNYPHPKIYEI